MGLDIDKFNEMINQASKIVSCDADCQRTKRQELLKKKVCGGTRQRAKRSRPTEHC